MCYWPDLGQVLVVELPQFVIDAGWRGLFIEMIFLSVGAKEKP